jgi:hypothetical protein
MTRTGRVLLFAWALALLAASPARAQLSLSPLTGVGTIHLGATTGDDIGKTSFTLGGSVAVVEESGWGAEMDFGYADGDYARTGRADVQSYMLNLIGIWPKGSLRPFLVAGLGGLRVHACGADCAEAATWLDWGWNAGGGAHYFVNNYLGLRGDVRYFSALDDHPDPARPDDFGFWRVSAGVSLLWNTSP